MSHVSVSMLVPSYCEKKSCSVSRFSGEGDEIKEDAHQKVVIGVRFPAMPLGPNPVYSEPSGGLASVFNVL